MYIYVLFGFVKVPVPFLKPFLKLPSYTKPFEYIRRALSQSYLPFLYVPVYLSPLDEIASSTPWTVWLFNKKKFDSDVEFINDSELLLGLNYGMAIRNNQETVEEL